jgi:hypothetical protein
MGLERVYEQYHWDLASYSPEESWVRFLTLRHDPVPKGPFSNRQNQMNFRSAPATSDPALFFRKRPVGGDHAVRPVGQHTPNLSENSAFPNN